MNTLGNAGLALILIGFSWLLVMVSTGWKGELNWQVVVGASLLLAGGLLFQLRVWIQGGHSEHRGM